MRSRNVGEFQCTVIYLQSVLDLDLVQCVVRSATERIVSREKAQRPHLDPIAARTAARWRPEGRVIAAAQAAVEVVPDGADFRNLRQKVKGPERTDVPALPRGREGR